MLTKYNGIFEDWETVQSRFEDSTPEPEEVIYAWYDYEDYNGDAVVVYRNGDKYYLTEGGHCSCYGLEGQFDPEEYTLEQFVAVLEKRNSSKYEMFWVPLVLEEIRSHINTQERLNGHA